MSADVLRERARKRASVIPSRYRISPAIDDLRAIKRHLREKEIAADRELQRALDERHEALREAWIEGVAAGVEAGIEHTVIELWALSDTKAKIDRELGLAA